MADLTTGILPKALGPTTIGDSVFSESGGAGSVAGLLHVFGDLVAHGATSGTLALRAPAAAGTSVITFPVGTTNFTATGGAGQVLQQVTLGGPITVGALPAGSIGGLGAGVAAWLAVPSSANLAAALTDETGTGANVFANTPTLVTPLLGTPTSGVLTNCTGLPIASGISGLATGIAAFLATPSSANLRAALTDESGTGLAYFQGGALGTPASGTLTSCTGLPIAGLSGVNAGVATWLATPSSANLLAAVTDETGTGALVFATSPALVTPDLGVATAAGLSMLTSGGTLTTSAGGAAAKLLGYATSTYIWGIGRGATSGGGLDFESANDTGFKINAASIGAGIRKMNLDSTGLTLAGTTTGSVNMTLGANGAAAAARSYNARADASNGDWAYMGDWSGNVARYGTDKNGTGTVRDASFVYGGTEQFRMASAGVTFTAAIIQKPAASVTPANNGELMVQATSNTALAFKFKGSDGTVRTGTLTLT